MTFPLTHIEGSDILIVGEWPTADSVWKQRAFASTIEKELTNLLHTSNILITECSTTLVASTRPSNDKRDGLVETAKTIAAKRGFGNVRGKFYYPDSIALDLKRLEAEIALVKPKIILALGELALWALTGENSISTWRGSHMRSLPEYGSRTVIPTYSISELFRVWDYRIFMIRDIQRIPQILFDETLANAPPYRFIIAPTADQVFETINMLMKEAAKGPLLLSVDIETISRHISCIGLGWSNLDAICIPFLIQGGIAYFNEETEVLIWQALRVLLTHPNVEVIGQNFIYDTQHFFRHALIIPRLKHDTMLKAHLLFPGLPKSLDTLASLHCRFYLYWKDELKDYKKMPVNIHQYWTYNCKDVVNTFEVNTALTTLIAQREIEHLYAFQLRMNTHLFNTMTRGVKIHLARRNEVAAQLMTMIAEMDALFDQIIGRHVDLLSPKQLQNLFYEELGAGKRFHKKTKKVTLDKNALKDIGDSDPILRPLTEFIAERRSFGVFLSTFCLMPLDADFRMRTSYGLAMTETFRLNSDQNAFGSGGNLQNIPKGDEK